MLPCVRASWCMYGGLLVKTAGAFGKSEARNGQATKGTRRMPWCQEAMKDVGSCEKLRRAATQAVTRRYPNGETRTVKPVTVH